MYDMQTALGEITGMHTFSLQPSAGAQDEWTGLMMIRAFHEANGDTKRTKVIVPDLAQGTNQASVSVAGFDTVTVKTNKNGWIIIVEVSDNNDIDGLLSSKKYILKCYNFCIL